MMLSCKDSESEYMHTVAVVLVVRVRSVFASCCPIAVQLC
jgi:hypothetical protein